MQKLLGVCFFSTILVLSYVATLHIITNRVDALHHARNGTERPRNVRLGGPVPLQPLSDPMPIHQKKYAVRKISRMDRVKRDPIESKVSKTKKKSNRRPASVEKKLKKKKKKH